CVLTTQDTSVQAGDKIEALGFPGRGEYSPVLQDAVFRKTGAAPPPLPIKMTAEGSPANYDGSLVQIEAQLLDRTERRHDQILELEAGNVIFNAQLQQDATANARLMTIPNHSLVRLAGICQVHVDQSRLPDSFNLLLRSATDVTLLERPSWWTFQHAM